MTDLETTLLALETELLQPSVRNQPARVDALLADGFVEFGSSGNVWTKAVVIERLRDEAPIARQIRDFEATLLAPDVALVTYRVERVEDASTTLRSSVWAREGTNWRMRFHQGTPTA
jgi:hypothetical protein